MVLYRFGSTGVVQCLSRAAEILGLVPVFPVRNLHTFSSGAGTAAFRDCVLVKKWVFRILQIISSLTSGPEIVQWAMLRVKLWVMYL